MYWLLLSNYEDVKPEEPAAYDEYGHELIIAGHSSKLDFDTMPCAHKEATSVALDREYLQKYADSGIRIKVIGGHDDVIINLPSGYIQGFLEAVPK